MKKALLVFYSRSGYTRRTMQELSKSFDCDIEEIIDLKNRKGLWGYIISGKDAVTKKESDIKESKYNPSDYDLIVIGTPVWASTMASGVRTYINKNKSKFKNTAVLVTSGGPVDNKIADEISSICGGNMKNSCNICKKEYKDGSWTAKLHEFTKSIK